MSKPNYNLLVLEQAQSELRSCGKAIHAFFYSIGELEKAITWADSFTDQVEDKLKQIKETPKRFPKCSLYPFNLLKNQRYYYFRVIWFLIFYEIDEATNTVIVASAKSDKSDLSAITKRPQTQ